MEKFHFSLAGAITQLAREKQQQFTLIMQNGSMSVEYYAPDKVDRQTPHKQDELYVIASGSGYFFATANR